MSALQSFKRWRRKTIKAAGLKLTKSLDHFLASQSLIGDHPVFTPASQFSYVSLLEDNWRPIRAELDTVLTQEDQIPAFHQISPDQTKISKGRDWKVYALYVFKEPVKKNCAECPETARVLAQIPGLQNAWFSILAPGYHVPPHRGVTKSLIRVHLALLVPEQKEQCTMRVGDVHFHWNEGECVVFDDTFKHEVHNNTDQTRAVLFLDIDRPMRWPGRLASGFFLRLLQWSAYVQDARQNLADWQQRQENVAARFEGYHLDAEDGNQQK